MKMRLALAGLVLLAGTMTASAQQSAPPATNPTSRAFGQGYLEPAELPNSLALLPMPPAAGSAAEARDIEAANATFALRGGPRWQLAAADADLAAERGADVFSCAAGRQLDPAHAPATNRLLRRAVADIAGATYAAKRQYQRQRPFMVNGQPTCTPDWEDRLRADGSYPSGHSAIGYGWGLILAELLPAHATELVARGRVFGDSRRVCNVHWLSDVEEGRVVAAAVVARIHADSDFQHDLRRARRELNRAGSAPDAAACASTAAALAL